MRIDPIDASVGPEKVHLGTFPTPVERLDALSTAGCELWVKRDDLTHPDYGGNKVRKLEWLLGEARKQDARRLLTMGAVGSHHVLATAIHGSRAGFPVAAVLIAQPITEGVVDNLRAGLAAGLEVHIAASYAQVPLVLRRVHRRGDLVILPGGSSVVGTMGYVDAAAELAGQIQQGLMPQPDAIVVALGSAGTAAGLLAGALRSGLHSRIVGVHVLNPTVVSSATTLLLARAVSRKIGLRVTTRELARRLETDASMLGRGYGYPTFWGDQATLRAQQVGLRLDATYTAKAFARALSMVEQGTVRTVLYWHTLSSAPMAALLANAPPASELPNELQVMLDIKRV